jgi:hypothetical protein
MDTEPLTESPAVLMNHIQQGINDMKSTLDDLDESKARTRNNHTLNSTERALLLSALEIKVVQGERELMRLQAKFATQRIKFQKATFWNSF